MATQDFDLREPPPPASDNPLHAYVRPPMALGVVTVAQFVIAILIILIAASAEPQNRAIESRLILATLDRPRYCPQRASVCCCARRVGVVANGGPLLLRLFRPACEPGALDGAGNHSSLRANLVVVGVAIVILTVLTHPEILHFIRFRTPDGRPTRRTLSRPLSRACCGHVCGYSFRSNDEAKRQARRKTSDPPMTPITQIEKMLSSICGNLCNLSISFLTRRTGCPGRGGVA